MKTEKTPESIADGTAPAVVCSAWLGSDIYWRIFTALGEYHVYANCICSSRIRLDDAEQDSAGRGGRSPSAIGVMRTIDEAALTLPNNSGQTDAPKS